LSFTNSSFNTTGNDYTINSSAIIINGISGEIFGAYIYGSNLELGFSESPSKLTLNIVKENGDFDFRSLVINIEIPRSENKPTSARKSANPSAEKLAHNNIVINN
jgi:hypothetical protein